MHKNIPYRDQFFCWVCLIQQLSGYEVSFVLNLSKIFWLDEPTRLVYFRRFDNLIDGIGHKLLLENISEQSLRRLITKNNPDNRNLIQEILEQ